MRNEPSDDLVKTLGDELTASYGPVLPSRTLATVLGYSSGDAFRQALSRKTVPVPVFRMPNRRGYFALTRDVSQWLVAQRQAAVNPQENLNPYRVSEAEVGVNASSHTNPGASESNPHNKEGAM